jgi:C-terminal processing protease CtpA/Prc
MPRSSRWGLALLASSLAVSLVLPRAQEKAAGKPLGEKDWDLFRRVFGLVLRDYVEPKTPQEVILGALKGAAASAGPECAYVPPEEVAAYRNASKPGAGLPLYVTKESDFARVISAYPGTVPAAKPGDLLRFVGDRSTYDMTFPQVLAALRGKAGEKVRCIFIHSDSWQSTTVSLAFQPPAPPAWTPLGTGGCLAVPCLEAPLAADVAKALRASRGPVVVDLRSCASGDVAAALRWAGDLLGKTEGPPRKGPTETKRDALAGEGLLAGRSIRVLVDGGTARGGEVLAAALVQAGALLLGSPTFGWAPYPEDLPLENGGLLRLNTSFFLGPDGEALKDHPMEPAVGLPAGKEGEDPCAWALKAAPAPKNGSRKHGR